MELNRKNIIKICGIVAFGIILALALANISKIAGVLSAVSVLLSPFIVGASIAFIINVPMSSIEKRLFKKQGKIIDKVKRPLSLVITLLILCAAVFLVLFLVVPEVKNTVNVITERFPGFIERAKEYTNDLAGKYPDIAVAITDYLSDLGQIWTEISGFIRSQGQNLISSVINAASTVIGVIVNIFVGIAFAVYILLAKEKLAVQCKRLLYSAAPSNACDKIVAVCRLAVKTFSRFLSGQCLEAFILGTMFFISMTIFRFDYALLISVLIMFTALIPVFGAFIGCAAGAFLIFVNSPVSALWFVIMFVIIQQIEGNLIYPYVVGSSVGLPSMWVLFAVIVGGNLFGVAGMLAFIPLFSVIYVLSGRVIAYALEKKHIPQEKWLSASSVPDITPVAEAEQAAPRTPRRRARGGSNRRRR